MMANYLSIWAEAVQAYESLANVVKTADEAIRQSLDLAARVEKLEAENYELKQQLAIAASDSDFRIPEWPRVRARGPSKVQLLIDGYYEDSSWYVRDGLASVVSRGRVRLDVRIVRGWRPQPDTGECHD
jgi:hypothetical protein